MINEQTLATVQVELERVKQRIQDLQDFETEQKVQAKLFSFHYAPCYKYKYTAALRRRPWTYHGL